MGAIDKIKYPVKNLDSPCNKKRKRCRSSILLKMLRKIIKLVTPNFFLVFFKKKNIIIFY